MYLSEGEETTCMKVLYGLCKGLVNLIHVNRKDSCKMGHKCLCLFFWFRCDVNDQRSSNDDEDSDDKNDEEWHLTFSFFGLTVHERFPLNDVDDRHICLIPSPLV